MFLIMPEVWLVIAMCAVVLVPFLDRRNVTLPTLVAIVGLGLAFLSSILTLREEAQIIFHGAVAIDHFSQFFKVILTLFSLLVVVQWVLVSRDKVDAKDVPDFLCLLLGATTGMALMASANNLLLIFVATEAASLPSFALAGFRKRESRSTEGSLKYVIFGSAASAIMVYGISLVYGATGHIDLAGVAGAAAEADGSAPLLAVGLLAMFAGFAFKLSAVPLHFWCPDVFQGAPIEVTTFLSVASKGAAICMTVRVLFFFGDAGTPGMFTGLATGVGILGAATATWGNLAALHQTNIKRLLAYSSIAHAGYMIMCASVAAISLGVETESVGGVSDKQMTAVAGGILFYLLVYTFMNLGAFTVAAVVARRTGSEEIEDYTGMSSRSPLIAILMSVFLLSLFGMPGLGGFLGKIMIGTAMGYAGVGAYVLLAALLLNTLFSLYYYMRPIYYMYLVKDDQDRPAVMPRGSVMAVLGTCGILLVVMGVGFFSETTKEHGRLVLRPAAEAPAAVTDTGEVDPADRNAVSAKPTATEAVDG